MTRRKNSSVGQNKKEQARLEIREFLQFPLSHEAAVEKERLDRQGLKLLLDKMVDLTAEYPGGPGISLEVDSDRGDKDGADEIVRAVCADYIERALPPSPWQDYAVRALRRPAPPSRWTLHRGGINERNFAIYRAVLAAERAGLKISRNRAQRYTEGAHSACSLVADELKKLGVRRSEDAVEKIYKGQVRQEKRKNEELWRDEHSWGETIHEIRSGLGHVIRFIQTRPEESEK